MNMPDWDKRKRMGRNPASKGINIPDMCIKSLDKIKLSHENEQLQVYRVAVALSNKW